MLFGSSGNGGLEMTQFLVPTASRTVSLVRRDALFSMSGLTAPGSPTREGQKWIFNVFTMLLWYTGTPSLVLDPKDPAIRVENLLKAY